MTTVELNEAWDLLPAVKSSPLPKIRPTYVLVTSIVCVRRVGGQNPMCDRNPTQ
jgi:hypothetical protein